MKKAGVGDKVEREHDRRGPKVLMVMNESASLGYHSNLVRALGYEVLTCGSYTQGLTLLHCDTFDFVTVGQGGHGFEGKKVVMEALEMDRSLPVLVLARTSNMKNYLEAMQLGAVDYLEMPVPPEEFLRVFRTHLRYRPAA